MTITAIEVGQTLINPGSDEHGYHVAIQMRLLPVQDADGQPMAISGPALDMLCNPLIGYPLVTLETIDFPDGHPGDDKLMQAVGGNILARLAAARETWVGRPVGP